jgi:GNAT superfamily N-acetyltransferase
MKSFDPPTFAWREQVRPADRDVVREIVESSGFFYDDEVLVAVELVDERLAKGEPSGYFFIFADQGGQTAGYACYGPIACTRSSYDVFWIAVRGDRRGGGLGRALLEMVERRIAERGGTRIYVETSSRDHYIPTRAFYERCAYRVEAVLEDFYGPEDSKVVFVKRVAPPAPSASL